MSDQTELRFQNLEDQLGRVANGMSELQTFMRFMMNSEGLGDANGKANSGEGYTSRSEESVHNECPAANGEPKDNDMEATVTELPDDHSYSVPKVDEDVEIITSNNLIMSTASSSASSYCDQQTDTPTYADRLAKYDQVEKLAPAVKEGLAMFINKTITTRLEPKKYKSICEKYHRPLNTDFLVCPRVNKELWSFINKDGPKNADLEIQELQKDYVKGLLPLVQAMNGLKEGSKEWACLADSFEIFAHQFMALNDKRRNLLKAASSLPKKLFSHEVPVTTKLFGDQFEEEIKKLDLDKKLMDSLQGSRFPPQQIWKQRRGGGL